jgi:hypothetical protein
MTPPPVNPLDTLDDDYDEMGEAEAEPADAAGGQPGAMQQEGDDDGSDAEADAQPEPGVQGAAGADDPELANALDEEFENWCGRRGQLWGDHGGSCAHSSMPLERPRLQRRGP